MKDILGLVKNVKSSWKTTLVGAIFIGVFIYDYVTATEAIEMVSIDTALLILGVSLMFAPDKTEEKECENPKTK